MIISEIESERGPYQVTYRLFAVLALPCGLWYLMVLDSPSSVDTIVYKDISLQDYIFYSFVSYPRYANSCNYFKRKPRHVNSNVKWTLHIMQWEQPLIKACICFILLSIVLQSFLFISCMKFSCRPCLLFNELMVMAQLAMKVTLHSYTCWAFN